jgi:hypothetical protein
MIIVNISNFLYNFCQDTESEESYTTFIIEHLWHGVRHCYACTFLCYILLLLLKKTFFDNYYYFILFRIICFFYNFIFFSI